MLTLRGPQLRAPLAEGFVELGLKRQISLHGRRCDPQEPGLLHPVPLQLVESMGTQDLGPFGRRGHELGEQRTILREAEALYGLSRNG